MISGRGEAFSSPPAALSPAMRFSFPDALPLVTLMAGIFILSHQPGNSLSLPAFFMADKLLHAMAYATLAASAIFADRSSAAHLGRPRRAISAFLLCLSYGASDELHQSFIPLRDASLDDLAADTVGAGLAIAAWLLWRFRHRRAKSA